MSIAEDYSALIVQIYDREKDSSRVEAVTSFFEGLGAIVELKRLVRCDYAISGFYREAEINLGIEHKTLCGDFFPSMEEMPGKLLESYQYYTDVALVVEEGNYSITLTEDCMDGWIQNPSMQAATGAEGVGTLASYNNFMGSMASNGIHTRGFRTVSHLPIVVSGLIKTISKPIHRGLAIDKPTNDKLRMANFLVKIDGIGGQGAIRGAEYIPNLERLINFSLSDMQDIWGAVKGKKAYACIHYTSRKEECAKAWGELYAKNAPKRKNEIDDAIKANKEKKGIAKPLPTTDNPPEIKKSIPDKNISQSLGTLTSESHAIDANSGIQSQRTIDNPTPIKESDLLPRVKDVLEYIRQKPRKTEDIQHYFDFTPEYTFKKLMEFKLAGKIWFENATRTWQFGKDQNQHPVKACPEQDIGV